MAFNYKLAKNSKLQYDTMLSEQAEISCLTIYTTECFFFGIKTFRFAVDFADEKE